MPVMRTAKVQMSVPIRFFFFVFLFYFFFCRSAVLPCSDCLITSNILNIKELQWLEHR